MPATASKKKTMLTHPRTGGKKNIDSTKYEPVKEAIMHSLKGSKGKTFTEMTDEVKKYMKSKYPSFRGSVPWYAISVRLDLETRGTIETFVEKGKKFARIRRRS